MSQEVSSTNKRIAKNTLFLYVRMLLVMGVSIFTSRVILQTLGVEDYGIYNAVEALVASSAFKMLFGGLFTTPLGLVTLAILGVATALTALYSRVKDAPKEFEKLSIEIK